MGYSKLTVPMNIATEPSSKYNGIPGTTKSSRSGNISVRSRGTIRIVPSFLSGIMPSHDNMRFLMHDHTIDVNGIIFVDRVENIPSTLDYLTSFLAGKDDII